MIRNLCFQSIFSHDLIVKAFVVFYKCVQSVAILKILLVILMYFAKNTGMFFLASDVVNRDDCVTKK